MNNISQVYIITFCRKLELLYGTTLIFDTVRTGFPSANITVIDNNSLPKAMEEIVQKAQEVGAEFQQLHQTLPHADLITNLLTNTNDSFAIIDPDVIFWSKFDQCSDSLMEGRLIPTFNDPYSGCLTHKRLHTSMLKVPNPLALRTEIKRLEEQFFEWSPVVPIMFFRDNCWERFDTLASLYSVLQEKCHTFTSDELDCYDHLFCGSHIDWVELSLKEWSQEFSKYHNAAKSGRVEQIKGVWRLQEHIFSTFKP